MLLVCLLSFQLLSAEEIRVAVANNFTATIKALAEKFEAQTSHKVILSFGATGRHYA